MKRSVKIGGAILLLVIAAFWYLNSEDGRAILNKAEAKNVLTLTGSKDVQNPVTETEGDGEQNSETEETRETEGTDPSVEETGFSELQKKELQEIITASLQENINVLMENGSLPAALSAYANVYSELVNINTAGIDELTQLNGIGPSKASAIVNYREEHGKFQSVDELTEVPGISTGTLEKLRDRITL